MTDVREENTPTVLTQYPGKAWNCSNAEPALDAKRRIVDPHHHFSDHWGGYGVNDLLEDVDSGHRIDATVFVQCGWHYRESGPAAMQPLGETDAVVRLAEEARVKGAHTAVAAGIVGYADLRLGNAVEDVLLAQIDAAKGRFRGVRVAGARHPSFQHGVLGRPPAALFSQPAFRQGLQCLARHDLSFDAWIYHTQIDEVVDLARALPQLSIILDHVGGILGVGAYQGQRELAFKEWSSTIGKLAACPNVVVKIGGYGTAVFGYEHMKQSEAPASEALAEAWRPSVETVIEHFGAERCMFESNFPVDRTSGSYGTVWNAFKRLAASASETEKSALFSGTASRVYRLKIE